METRTLGKPLKCRKNPFHAILWRVFRSIDIKVCRGSVTETLFPHLEGTRRDIRGPVHFTWKWRFILRKDEELGTNGLA